MTARFRTALLAVVAVLVACADSTVLNVMYDDQAIQVAHLAPGAGTFDVLRDTTAVARNLEFGEVVTRVVNPPGGTLRLINSDGRERVQQEVNASDLDQTWLISGEGGAPDLTELNDPPVRDSAMANLNVINAIPGSGNGEIRISFVSSDGGRSTIIHGGYLTDHYQLLVPGDYTIELYTITSSEDDSPVLVATLEHTFEAGIGWVVEFPDEAGAPGLLSVLTDTE